MRLFIAGDTHGNETFLTDYLYPTAAHVRADAIVQLGDFGAWEHMPMGVEFFDAVGAAATRYDLPLYWLHGNHDKTSLVLQQYADKANDEGFLRCRPGLYYIPQGHSWEWAGVRFRSFGGAYSVDKAWRIDDEHERHRKAWAKENYRRKSGLPPQTVPSTQGMLWFPEEEMTDGEMRALLDADSGPKDVIFSHDKPRSSNPTWNRKDIPECYPNQDRLQWALLAHQPKFWLHGHLHWLYQDTVRCGDDGRHTEVIGLAPDDNAAERFTKPWHAWCLLDLNGPDDITITSGHDLDDTDDDQVDELAKGIAA